MAGLCRANEEREGSRDCSVYSHVPCRLSSGGSAVHTHRAHNHQLHCDSTWHWERREPAKNIGYTWEAWGHGTRHTLKHSETKKATFQSDIW